LKTTAAACALAAAMAGCAGNRPGEQAPPPAAAADIRGFLPNTINGTARFIPSGTRGLRILVDVDGLLPNRQYAIHIHALGDCSSPEATGGHFDPGGSNTHGAPGGSPGAHHAGDLPNLAIDADGHGHLDFATDALGADSSDYTVIGRSIVIHAGPDDYTTQPSGNSGEKIACGVIRLP
jgi:Cu-Zn family superoxide dismutase